MGLYIDSMAAKSELGKDFDCLPPISLEGNQALAERDFPATCNAFLDTCFLHGFAMVFNVVKHCI